MKIISYKKLLGKFKLEMFGIKLTYTCCHKKLNSYISLGTNCFVRRIFTEYGLKPKKKQGELSCPFDLCHMSVKSVAEILENNFYDFTDNITAYGDENTTLRWFNKKYSIGFNHDTTLTLNEFKERYQKRIENFRNISHNAKFLTYAMAVYNRNFCPEDLNRIYNALLKLRNGQDFEFIVLSFVDNSSPEKSFNINNLNPSIKYNEYDVRNIKKFMSEWFHKNGVSDDILEKIDCDIKLNEKSCL